jgi:hypothetical protein
MDKTATKDPFSLMQPFRKINQILVTDPIMLWGILKPFERAMPHGENILA